MSIIEREGAGSAPAAPEVAVAIESEGESAPILPAEEVVTLDNLLSKVQAFADEKARLVTITCLDTGAGFDLVYHFDRDLALSHLRLRIREDDEVPSISGIYLSAFLVENEIKELFGVNIAGLAIDFGGRLLLTAHAPAVPLRKRAPANTNHNGRA